MPKALNVSELQSHSCEGLKLSGRKMGGMMEYDTTYRTLGHGGLGHPKKPKTEKILPTQNDIPTTLGSSSVFNRNHCEKKKSATEFVVPLPPRVMVFICQPEIPASMPAGNTGVIAATGATPHAATTVCSRACQAISYKGAYCIPVVESVAPL